MTHYCNYTYTARMNWTARTVTIREYDEEKRLIAKYRTKKLPSGRFHEFEYMDSNDIESWMKHNRSYYSII